VAQSDAVAERQSAQRVERENRSAAAREAKADAAKKSKRVVIVGEPGPVKIPGAMLLILIGLVVLWLATNGQLDRLGKAWSYVLGHADLPGPSGANAPAVKPASATATLLDTPSYHVANILADSDAPGGMY
jgi:hypothetical protein